MRFVLRRHFVQNPPTWRDTDATSPTMLRVCRRAQKTVEHSDNTWTLRLADGARRLPCRRLTVLWPMGRHSSCHSWTEAPETDSTVTLPERL